MAENNRHGALALIASGLLALTAGVVVIDRAHAAESLVRRPAVQHRPAARLRAVRTAAARPLTIRRRVGARPVDVVAGPGLYDDYVVRQHGWNDPRLYYFGPFRTGGDVFYGDEAGNPITRGNAALGRIAGYGPARGGFGGPHFDAVGGFHNGPGPDAGIDSDYASGSLSRPDYGDMVPRYPSVKEQVASLDKGMVPRRDATTSAADRLTGRRLTAEGRSTTASFEEAKARFAAPMARQAPIEAAFGNGGVPAIDMGIANGEF